MDGTQCRIDLIHIGFNFKQKQIYEIIFRNINTVALFRRLGGGEGGAFGALKIALP